MTRHPIILKGVLPMELRVLRYFLVVAREENITRAAEMLHITQPTLSRQLTLLEEELGVKLLERGGRRIVLTGEGVLLRRRAEELVALADKTEQELLCQSAELEGHISIGTGETAAVAALARPVDDARRRGEHPRGRKALARRGGRQLVQPPGGGGARRGRKHRVAGGCGRHTVRRAVKNKSREASGQLTFPAF